MKSFLAFLVLASVLFLSQMSNADILAAWDVEGVDLDSEEDTGIDDTPADEDYTYTAGTMATNIADAKLTLGNVNRSTTQDQYGFKISSDDETTSLSDAINANHYFQFNIEVDDGYLLDLNEVGILGESTGTGADDIALLAKVKGFDESSELYTASEVSGTDWDFTKDLSVDNDFQNQRETISFRLYGWDTSSGHGVTRIYNDDDVNDLQIKGTVTAVPEPGSLFLVLVGGVFLLTRRRSSM